MADFEVDATKRLPVLEPGQAGLTASIDGVEHVWNGQEWCKWEGLDQVVAKWLRGKRESDEMSGIPLPHKAVESSDSLEMVKHPRHYLGTRPMIWIEEHDVAVVDGEPRRVIECLEIMRHIQDPRLATAFKYIWRVAFGGKPQHGKTQEQADLQDIDKARAYLEDYLQRKANEVER